MQGCPILNVSKLAAIMSKLCQAALSTAIEEAVTVTPTSAFWNRALAIVIQWDIGWRNLSIR